MSILAQHSYTIRRLIDGKTLNFLLESNHAQTQVFTPSPDTYLPDYTASNLVITPSLIISGEAGNQMSHVTGVTWLINNKTLAASGFTTSINSTSKALSIKSNIINVAQIKIQCSGVYVQPVTGIEMNLSTTYTVTKMSNTGANVIAFVTTPLGDIFKNDEITMLTAVADLVRGSEVDKTDVSYVWYKRVGASWVAIGPDDPGLTGYTSDTLSITQDGVLNVANFKCDLTDTDQNSSTVGQTVSGYASFTDMSDPYQIEVDLVNGDGIISGGSIMTRTHVRQGRDRKNAAFYDRHTIKHFRYDVNGSVDPTWGTGGYKTVTGVNRELEINESDLNTGKMSTAFGVELHTK